MLPEGLSACGRITADGRVWSAEVGLIKTPDWPHFFGTRLLDEGSKLDESQGIAG